MKKLFFGVLAIAGLVACVQEDVLNAPNLKNEIGFGGYVNGAVRTANPSTTTESIDHFTVWAYMDDKDGNVLTDELVSKSGDVWTYSNVQYWLKKHQYHFFALTPYVAGETNNAVVTLSEDPYTNYLGGLAFTNVEGTEDLLYATATPDTFQSIPEFVQFDFDHLLSKVKFTFVNGFTTDNIDIAVTNVKMVVPQTAETTLGAQVHNGYVWTKHAGETVLDFGHAAEGARIDATKNAGSDNERLTFPAQLADNLTYKVTFTVDVFVGTQEVSADTHNLEVTVNGVEFVAGKAYNFVAEITNETLDLKKIEFKVTVDEWDVEPDFNLGVVGNTEVKVVYSYDELQAVLDDAAARGVSVNAILGADIAGQVKVQEIPGVVTTIDGHNHTLTGAILVDGKSGYKGATTVVKNVNFVADAATLVNGDSFIWCGEALGTNLRYPDNITVENCTFTATGNTAVGVKVWSLNGKLVVKGCEADGVHSLMQLTSCGEAEVSVENVTIKNAKNGISLDNASTVTIKGANIASKEYGIRANADRHAEDAKTVIEETTITAKQPIVVRKVTKAGYALTLGAGVVLNTEEAHQVIFTKGSDDAAYVAPEVEFAYSSVADFIVFPEVSANAVKAATAEELAQLLDDSTVATITLADGANFGTIVMKSNKTIVGAPTAKVDCVSLYGADNITLKNIVFDAATAKMSYDGKGNAKQYANIVTDHNGGSNTPNNPSYNVVIDGCTFQGTFANGGAAIAFTDQNRSGGFVGNVTIKNCAFNTVGSYYDVYGHYCGNGLNGYGDFVLENNVFKSARTQGLPVYLGRYASSTPVVVAGNAFETATSLENAVYVQDHGNYGVSVAASNNTFAN